MQNKVELPEKKPETDVLIVDSLVNTVRPKTPKTFAEYARNDILPEVEYFGVTYKRTDIIFDVYHQSSLKSEARSKLGKAMRRIVTTKSKTPRNWEFSQGQHNKLPG